MIFAAKKKIKIVDYLRNYLKSVKKYGERLH